MDGARPDLPPWLGFLVHGGNEASAAIDAEGTVVYANPAAIRLLGSSEDALVGANIVELIHPDDLERVAVNVEGLADGARPRPGLLRLRQADGTWRALELAPAAIELPDPPHGPGPITVVTIRDNHLQEAHWEFLRAVASGQPFEACLETLAVGLSTDVDGDLVIAFGDAKRRHAAGVLPPSFSGIDADGRADGSDGSPWAKVTSSEEAAVLDVHDLPDPLGADAAARGYTAAVAVLAPDPGSDHDAMLVMWVHTRAMVEIVRAAMVKRPHQAVVLALSRRHEMDQLEHLAHHDGLTGLANREHFFEELAGWSMRGTALGVVYLDLDRFKPVNDRLGHAVGDEVLVEVARRIETEAGPKALVARLGGDEFVVATRASDDQALDLLADRLVSRLSEPMVVGEHIITIGASAGCARTEGDQTIDALVARADTSLYTAKRSGRSTWHHEPLV